MIIRYVHSYCFFWIKICRIEASNHLIIIQSKKSSFSFWSNKDSQFPFWSRNIHICTILTTSYYQQQKTLLLLFKKKRVLPLLNVYAQSWNGDHSCKFTKKSYLPSFDTNEGINTRKPFQSQCSSYCFDTFFAIFQGFFTVKETYINNSKTKLNYILQWNNNTNKGNNQT